MKCNLNRPDLGRLEDEEFLELCRRHPQGKDWQYRTAFNYAAIRLANIQGLHIAPPAKHQMKPLQVTTRQSATGYQCAATINGTEHTSTAATAIDARIIFKQQRRLSDEQIEWLPVEMLPGNAPTCSKA